jgi:hypothetical protein
MHFEWSRQMSSKELNLHDEGAPCQTRKHVTQHTHPAHLEALRKADQSDNTRDGHLLSRQPDSFFGKHVLLADKEHIYNNTAHIFVNQV